MREYRAMKKLSYNEIAGGSLERIAALSDGLFAIAMTLLVLDLKLPNAAAIHSEQDLAQGLLQMSPRLLMFAMGFLTLGIFWTGQQTQLRHFARGDRNLGWIHLAFLFAASVMPFSTMLLAEFLTYRLALLVYWLNILALGAMLYWSWRYALRTGLLKEDVSYTASCAIERRILIAQALYALGALFSVWNTLASIGFIFALQLYYAIAPRLRIAAESDGKAQM
jgi:uncharacterized membrane protein